MTSIQPGRRPEVVATTALYVVPLLLTSAFLVHVGLWVLGLALLVIEASMTALVVAVKRRPARPSRVHDGSTVLLALGGAVLAVALVIVGVVALG